MIRSHSVRWYTCRFCGKKVALEYGNGLHSMINHLYEHRDQLEKHKHEPIYLMIDNCYEIK